ncbi:hypothetical protein [Sphingobium scionense]|uniref:Uncharacterized protein n=1 Tax=Sphingobium scionense TaxID=1404341 RepID=A0A7W6LPB6_9SPHN|nr:hypothetical protein [Sphingobium scionense]MBB4148040.1 hypothetical protein [Sphingobium scionense]
MAQEDRGSEAIRYIFPTLLVPDKADNQSQTIKKKGAWLLGKAVPVRAVVLEKALPISEKGIFLEKGTVFSVANSAQFMACQKNAPISQGIMGMGKSPVCLIDRDGDGVLDSWFKSSINIIWGGYYGHLKRDDIYPIDPVPTKPLTISEVRGLEPWGTFEIRYAQGMLTYCVDGTEVCRQNAPKIKPSDLEQTVEFMGGAFSYKKTDGDKLIIKMIREPKGEVY